MWFEILDATGRLRALTSPAEARAALRRGTGLGAPPAIGGYDPSAAQIRFVKARDRHCRFPGCSRPAEYVDLDHVIPCDHDDPGGGGPTCVTNLVCLCRSTAGSRPTHRAGCSRWIPTAPCTSHHPVAAPAPATNGGVAQVDMSTPTQSRRPHRPPRTHPEAVPLPTPEQRAARRAAAADRARLAAEIEAELDAAWRACRRARAPGTETVERGGSRDETTQDTDRPAGDRRAASRTAQDPPPF